MNKKLLKSFAAAAMSVLAIACAKEPVTGDGQTVEATFDVDVPGVEVSTKGLSDAASVNELICQVFLKGAKDKNKHFVYTPVPELTQKVAVVGGKATVKLSLVKGQTYSFAFWAQTSDTGYYTTDDLRSVTMNTDLVKANDPKMDAFFAIKDEARVTVSYSKVVHLKRALAQVNFGTKYSGRSDELTAQKSYVTLTGVPNVFHPFMSGDSFACEGSETVKFNENEVVSDESLSANGTEYSYLASAYVFALNPNTTITDASAVVTLNNGKTTTIKAPNAPMKRNFRTNILGDLLTVDAEWNVDILPAFDGDNTYDAVSANLEKGATVTLAENYSVDSKSKGVTIGVGVTSVLNLNGKKFSNENAVTDNKAALQVHGDLTINGEGEVYCAGGAVNNAIIVEQGGHLVINGGTYNVGKANSGKSNATIFVLGPDINGRNGSVEINGGVFMAEAGSDGTPFVLNQHDDITVNCFSVKGGIFVGFNPASVNEAHGAITSFVAEGYKSVKTTYEGKQAWKVEAIPTITPDELAAALDAVGEGETAELYLGAGEFSFAKSNCKGNIVVKGTSKAETIVSVPNASRCYDNKSISFENVTLKCTNGYVDDAREALFPRTDVSFVNCKIEGTFAAVGSVVASFKGCEFAAGTAGDAQYAIKYYGGDKTSKLVLDNCIFNTYGKCILMFNEAANTYDASISGCKFNASETVEGKAAIQMHTESGIKGNLTISDCTVSGFDSTINGGLWNEINNNTKVHTTKFTVVVNGTTVQSAK